MVVGPKTIQKKSGLLTSGKTGAEKIIIRGLSG